VLDVGQAGPEPGARLCARVRCPLGCRVLVAGGDGTVGWVLSALEQEFGFSNLVPPPVGVVPLGTGNDLSRVLGFGAAHHRRLRAMKEARRLLVALARCRPVPIDRWTVSVETRRLGRFIGVLSVFTIVDVSKRCREKGAEDDQLLFGGGGRAGGAEL